MCTARTNRSFVCAANFALPSEGAESPFKEITFVDLQREEATKLVEKYNKVSRTKKWFLY